MVVIMLVTVYVCVCELGTSGQVPKSGTVKPNVTMGRV
jgi:hypothetical protein